MQLCTFCQEKKVKKRSNNSKEKSGSTAEITNNTPTLDPPDVWDQLLPADPGARNLAITLLADWEGTLQEAIGTAELLTAA